MTESAATTVTRHRHGETLTELTLTVPTALLELLAEGADRAHESYGHGADTEAELMLDEHLLGPLANLLYRALQTC